MHGDIKSSNVLLTAAGGAKLADIAFSRRYQPRASRALELQSFVFDPPQLAGTFNWWVGLERARQGFERMGGWMRLAVGMKCAREAGRRSMGGATSPAAQAHLLPVWR